MELLNNNLFMSIIMLGFFHSLQNTKIETFENAIKKEFLNLYNYNIKNDKQNINYQHDDIHEKLNKLIHVFNVHAKNKEDKIVNGLHDISGEIGNGIQDCFSDIEKQIDNKFLLILNKIDNFIIKINDKINNFEFYKKSNKKRHKEIGKNTKYCGYDRSRNKGSCKCIILKEKQACKYHLKNKDDKLYSNVVDISKPIKSEIINKDEYRNYNFNNPEKHTNNNVIIKDSILYPCKNNCCIDEVMVDGQYCNDCKKEIKICNICKNNFWTDEKGINKCEDCIYSMNMEGVYEEDEEDEEDYILIKCLNCKSYIPDIIKDKLCYNCGSYDKYWL